MSAITVTAAQVAVVFPTKAEIVDAVAGASITAGQAVCYNSVGTVSLADADGSGVNVFDGVALNAAGTGQGVSILRRGHMYGADLASLAYRALVYVSNTAGGLDTAAGTTSLIVGRVVPLSDSDKTKVLFVTVDPPITA